MKAYVIRDNDFDRNVPVGYLFCYEGADKYLIELCSGIDEWEAPLLFQKNVREGTYTISEEAALLWVRERVIPSGRQNIGAILKNANMKEYNERMLLIKSQGRCAQDNCSLAEIALEDIPEDIKSRWQCNVTECFPADGLNIICMFRDNLVRKVSLEKLEKQYQGIGHVLRNPGLMQTIGIKAGGYGVSFSGVIGIPVNLLREEAFSLPIVAADFFSFAQNGIVDTTKACEIMQCSRQNISYLVGIGKLEPVIYGTKENLFTRGSLEKVICE